MRDLERTLQTAAPPIGQAPAELEDRIWTALGYEVPVATELGAPVLLVDEAPPLRRPSRFGLALGIAAVAAALVAAVVVAGLRDGSRPQPGGKPSPPSVTTPDPKTAIGKTYFEGTCPDPDRGACFEPFPAGRYTFHKSNPQVTITVGDGWTNDAAWPDRTAFSRSDTRGATLELLTDAQPAAVAGDPCDVTAVRGAADDASGVATALAARPDLVATKPVRARLGELSGYVLDLAPRTGAQTVSCPDGTAGVPVLMAPAIIPNAGRDWAIVLAADQRARIVVADTSLGRTVAVVAIATGTRDDLETWLTAAQPVVDSITFAPCTTSHVFFQACEPVPKTASP